MSLISLISLKLDWDIKDRLGQLRQLRQLGQMGHLGRQIKFVTLSAKISVIGGLFFRNV
ncbi:MAG: hypothetical protein LBT09_05375 [Planctomycetaceae bacterium]|jgi:hypothetical protein|nr:hypothetical protein [Planctomycetaceae bacterium]